MIAQRMAEFITGTGFDALPEKVVVAAKSCIIDWIGSALAGSEYPQAEKVRKLIKNGGGTGPASLIGTGIKEPPVMAAFYNGVSSHTVELDDLHRKTMLHPGAAVISAAWAAAEAAGASGKELITAVVLGYEVAIRTAEAVIPSHYHYWYPTGTCGVFGAAAAAARLTGLGNDQVVHALGNAGTMAAGLWEFRFEKAMSKQLHAGKAASNGVLAAQLAQIGFTGPSSIYDGSQGFLRAYSKEPRPAMLEKDLGANYRINEITFKLYPSGRHTHGGIDLALRLRDRGISAGDVELVRIKTYSLAREMVGNPNPADPVEARFSLPFCVATTLLYGHPTLKCFCRERIEDQALRRIMSHVTVEVDPEIELLYPGYWTTVVEVIDSHSHIVRERTDFPKGDPENPAAATEIHNKFLGLARESLGEQEAEKLMARLLELEQAEDIREVMPG